MAAWPFCAGSFARGSGEYDADGIEYLELQPDWNNTDQTGVLSISHRLSITAVGYILQQDVELNEYIPYRAGTRIRWSIMCRPLSDLLNLPLRIEERISISETKNTGKRGRKRRFTTLTLTPSLFQIIDGILWELSFCGDAKQTAEFTEQLTAARANEKSWTLLDKEDLLDCLESVTHQDKPEQPTPN